MQVARIPHYSLADYLTLEQHADERHEYLAGEIVAKTCASRAHNLIAGNIHAVLRNHLRGSGCNVYMSDMKLHIEIADHVFYPDVMVGCGPSSDPQHDYLLTDARLIVEVLSPSTSERDREYKRVLYQRLPGLREYLLVAQDRPAVSCYRRLSDGWERIDHSAGESVRLDSLDLELPLATIYEDIPLC